MVTQSYKISKFERITRNMLFDLVDQSRSHLCEKMKEENLCLAVCSTGGITINRGNQSKQYSDEYARVQGVRSDMNLTFVPSCSTLRLMFVSHHRSILFANAHVPPFYFPASGFFS